MKCNQSRPGFELVSPCPFPTTITTTPRAPHKVPTIRPPASHHENYPSLTNQTCRTLLEKQGRAHKRCTPMDPGIWPSKSRTISLNIHTAACEDTGCSLEDLPEAMNDREKWRGRVRDIHANSTTWWWWWWCIV